MANPTEESARELCRMFASLGSGSRKKQVLEATWIEDWAQPHERSEPAFKDALNRGWINPVHHPHGNYELTSSGIAAAGLA